MCRVPTKQNTQTANDQINILDNYSITKQYNTLTTGMFSIINDVC